MTKHLLAGPVLQRNMRNICIAHVTRWSSRPRPLHWHLCGGILQWLPAWSSPFFTAQSAGNIWSTVLKKSGKLHDLHFCTSLVVDESARKCWNFKSLKIRHILILKVSKLKSKFCQLMSNIQMFDSECTLIWMNMSLWQWALSNHILDYIVLIDKWCQWVTLSHPHYLVAATFAGT